MLGDMEQARRRIINQAHAAETPEQIKAAKAALKRWQAAHPNDPATNTLLGQLSLREAKDKARMGLAGPLCGPADE